MHVALRKTISRQQDSIHTRGRHGASDRVALATGARSATADHAERRRSWRSSDVRAVHPDGARKVVAGTGAVGYAKSASAFMAIETLFHPTRGGSLYDGSI